MSQTLLRLETWALVAIGGFTGASIRYGIEFFAPSALGTLVGNVIGCFLLGFLWYEASYSNVVSERSQVVFGTGFLSSLTTYSTFAYETAALSPVYAAVNVFASYTLGFGAVIVGRAIAMQLEEATHG